MQAKAGFRRQGEKQWSPDTLPLNTVLGSNSRLTLRDQTLFIFHRATESTLSRGRFSSHYKSVAQL